MIKFIPAATDGGNMFGAGFGGFLGAILGNNGFLGGGNGNAAAAAAVASQNTDMLSQQIQTLGQTVNANHASDLVLGGINSVNANIGDVNGNINDFARQMQDMCCQCKTCAANARQLSLMLDIRRSLAMSVRPISCKMALLLSAIKSSRHRSKSRQTAPPTRRRSLIGSATASSLSRLRPFSSSATR